MKSYSFLLLFLIFLTYACKKDAPATGTFYTANYKIFDSSYGYYSYNYVSPTHQTTVEWDSFYVIDQTITLRVDTINSKSIIYGPYTFKYQKGSGYILPSSFGFDITYITVTADSVILYHERNWLEEANYHSYVRGYKIP